MDQEYECNLGPRELSRYARQMSMPELGMEGQHRLRAGSVLCIGAGGLGSPALMYLAAAGVGRIGIVDADTVEHCNLHRQLLYTENQIGRKKAEAARETLQAVNPHVEVSSYVQRFTAENAAELVGKYDVILDGSDNFATRYLSSDVATWLKKPNIYGSVMKFDGQVTVFAPHLGGPCYRCFLPHPPAPGAVPNCAESGVLGILPGIIGLMQATEAIKLLTGLGEPLVGRFVHFEALGMKFREFKLRRDPDCPVCGESPTITEPIDYDAWCGAADVCELKMQEMTVQELQGILQHPTEKFLLLDVREPFEIDIASIPGARCIPLGNLPAQMDSLPREHQIAVLCKSGGRSAKAVELLRSHGFSKVLNVAGGIHRWAQEIDPSMPTY